MPGKMDNVVINNTMRNIGSPGVIRKNTKICINSNKMKDRIYDELKKRKTVIHCGGVKWADDKIGKLKSINWKEQLKKRCGKKWKKEKARTY